MTDEKDFLARLNIGGQSYEFTSRGTPALTREELAASLAMGNLSKNAYLFALAYYMEDEKARMELEIQLWIRLAGYANEHKWKVIKGKETLRMLCRLALAEWIIRRPCKTCGGEGKVTVVGGCNRIDCGACHATGIQSFSGREQASFVGLGNSRWVEVWSRRYEVPFGWVKNLVCELSLHFK